MSTAMEQERDRVAGRKVGTVGIVSVLVSVAGVVVSTLLLHEHPTAREVPVTEPSVIGIVEQSPIRTASRAADLKRAQLNALKQYRYLDASHETAEIPVDRAIQIIVEKAR